MALWSSSARSPAPRWVGAAEVAALGAGAAVAALEAALLAGLDPEAEALRTAVTGVSGTLLTMPSASPAPPGHLGAKLVTVRSGPAPAGSSAPAVQGLYALFDGTDLSPVAVLDGAALTALRTPAVTALAVRALRPAAPATVVLFGTGVQARAHARVLAEVLDVERIEVVGRDTGRTAWFVRDLRDAGLPAAVGGAASVRRADVICCCTSATAPLFDSRAVRPSTVVAATGAYTPATRETDTALARRAFVVVESRASALRESGDVLVPISSGDLDPASLVPLADVVTGAAEVPGDRPRLFTSTGMSWQDLAVASAVLASLTAPTA